MRGWLIALGVGAALIAIAAILVTAESSRARLTEASDKITAEAELNHQSGDMVLVRYFCMDHNDIIEVAQHFFDGETDKGMSYWFKQDKGASCFTLNPELYPTQLINVRLEQPLTELLMTPTKDYFRVWAGTAFPVVPMPAPFLVFFMLPEYNELALIPSSKALPKPDT